MFVPTYGTPGEGIVNICLAGAAVYCIFSGARMALRPEKCCAEPEKYTLRSLKKYARCRGAFTALAGAVLLFAALLNLKAVPGPDGALPFLIGAGALILAGNVVLTPKLLKTEE